MQKIRGAMCLAALLAIAAATSAEPLPKALQGSWRITRILQTTNKSCWSHEKATPLIGTTLTYSQSSMHWRDGDVPLQDIATRQLTDADFRKENPGPQGPATFQQLGIAASAVTEVDLQHDDADITGSTTEVPGDSVLLVSPSRIVMSACGVYFEAVKTGAAPHHK
jgi:hypothetical protein